MVSNSDERTRVDALWTDTQLAVLNETDELRLTIAGKAVIIWMVTVDGLVYVRSVYGRHSKWFERALTHGQGEASAGRIRQQVQLVEPDGSERAAVDAAFRSKYQRYAKSIVDSTVTAKAQGASLQLLAQP